MDAFLEYYSRKEVQEAILRFCKDREVAPRFGEGFGRRPDVMQYPGDVLDMAQKGATSFHISEERWEDPLRLKPGMTKKDLEENRIGWDLILDIDVAYWDYAKWTAYFLIEALKFHDVKNISLKFSGSKGVHIAVPFESFPKEVHGKKTKYLFPEGPRIITAYLENMILEMLRNKILEKENIEKICERTGMKKADLLEDGKFNPFKIIEIDTVLISSRHLFRAPYSLHEKTKLVSVPIDINKILQFEKTDAEPNKVKMNLEYLEAKEKEDATGLIIQAFDWWGRKNMKIGPDVEKKEIVISKEMIGEEYFPACIKKILNGMDDGKKRGLFILLNFFRSINWKDEDIDKRVKEWNAKNKQPLGASYIQGQLNWAKKQSERILPPNCSNKAYYSDLRIACNPEICAKFKNPVNCAKWNEKISKKQPKS
jgi:DNA primase catalytic subunit